MLFVVRIVKGLHGFAFKLILLPLIAVLTIVQYICIAAAHFSSLFFDFIGGLIIVTGILSYYFELEPINVMWRMIAAGAGLYILPMLVGELASWIVLIKETMVIRLLI